MQGINAIVFYAPVLFSSIGSGHTAALLNTVIIGAGTNSQCVWPLYSLEIFASVPCRLIALRFLFLPAAVLLTIVLIAFSSLDV